MRRLTRPPLDPDSVATLAKMQAVVAGAPDPAAKAKSVWASRGTRPRRAAFVDVRTKLAAMSGAMLRCVYCEDSRGTDIDHHRPKSAYPNFAFVWSNYFLACSHCNSNEKRTEFPLNALGLPLLIDPVCDDPFTHLVFVEKTGYVIGITPQGMATEKVFGLNRRQELTAGRQATWTSALALFRELKRALRPAPLASYAEVVATVRRLPFQAVVFHLLRDAVGPGASVPKDVAQVVRRTRAEWQGDYL